MLEGKKNRTLNNINIGIAISTYTNKNTDNKRYDIIKKSLSSLKNIIKKSKISIYPVIVVDGNIPNCHNKLLHNYDFDIYQRKENGGVSKTKNTSIRLLLEKSIDIGFLADDDVLYKDGCFEKYIEAILITNIPHFGFTQMHPLVHPKNEWEKMGYLKDIINNFELMKHGGGGVGCFLSFTPKLINDIGYFKILPGKYGYEHINFTYRCVHNKKIPYPVDIINSLNYIDHIGFLPTDYNKFTKIHSIDNSYRIMENKKNKKVWKKNLDKYVPLIE